MKSLLKLSYRMLIANFFYILLTSQADSLWDHEFSRSMFADKKASNVGDIITILVQESSSASKEASAKTSKKSSINAGIEAFLYGPKASKALTKGGQYPALKLGGESSFTGGGQVNNSERITARIAVTVVDVLPNGNLIIEGRRRTAFSGEVQEVILRGVVRPDDILPNNTIYSYNVADVNIMIISSGSASDTQKRGWLQKIWDKVSPF